MCFLHLEGTLLTSPAVEQPADHAPTSFLSLPAELRNYVYSFCGDLMESPCGSSTDVSPYCIEPPEGEPKAKDRMDVVTITHKKCAFSCHGRTSIWVNRNGATSKRAQDEVYENGEEANNIRRLRRQGDQVSKTSTRVKTFAERRRKPTVYDRENHRQCCLVNSPCSTYRHSTARAQQPAITQVCRVVGNETLPIFYGERTFMFTLFGDKDRASFKSWLSTIGPSNAGLLRNVKDRL